MKYLVAFILFTQLLSAEDEFKVVIFGTNYSLEDSAASITNPDLEKLFTSIKSHKPNAVFFTGDLVMDQEYPHSFDPEKFKKNLDYFLKIKDTSLGKEIPFYPTLGNHQHSTYDMIEIFRDHFNIQKISPRPPYHLAYTVPIDGAEFIILATGYEEPMGTVLLQKKTMGPILEWLEKYLAANSGSYKYRFVLSHFPAFSSSASSGVYLGLDKDPTSRDIFWDILSKNHVSAYFCSYEPLYDRSNRQGVWQIISGGIISDSLSLRDHKNFTNYLLLIWGGENELPILKVYDLEGQEWDTFYVIPPNFPVHQMRISEKFIEIKGE
jgi:hypothetical protein